MHRQHATGSKEPHESFYLPDKHLANKASLRDA